MTKLALFLLVSGDPPVLHQSVDAVATTGKELPWDSSLEARKKLTSWSDPHCRLEDSKTLASSSETPSSERNY